MIKDLHKECVCASCKYFSFDDWCTRLYITVKPWNLCPQYEESDDWKRDPAPRSGGLKAYAVDFTRGKEEV